MGPGSGCFRGVVENAVASNQLEYVRFLLEASPIVDAANEYYKPSKAGYALHALPEAQSPEMVRLLIQNGADPNHCDSELTSNSTYAGCTVLHKKFHLRTMRGDVPFNIMEVIKALVEAGADPTIRTNSGKTPLDILRKTIQRLRDRTALVAQLLPIASFLEKRS